MAHSCGHPTSLPFGYLTPFPPQEETVEWRGDPRVKGELETKAKAPTDLGFFYRRAAGNKYPLGVIPGKTCQCLLGPLSMSQPVPYSLEELGLRGEGGTGTLWLSNANPHPPSPFSLLESGSNAAGFGPSKERHRHLVVMVGLAAPALQARFQAVLGMDWNYLVVRKNQDNEVWSVAMYCSVKFCTPRPRPE